jgi:hypothetical protein
LSLFAACTAAPAGSISPAPARDVMKTRKPPGVKSGHAILNTGMPVVLIAKNLQIHWRAKNSTISFPGYLPSSSHPTGLPALQRSGNQGMRDLRNSWPTITFSQLKEPDPRIL